MIQINNLHKFYGQKEILKDINISIPKGKVTAILGPNGSGKSTLLSCISRLEPYDNGEIFLDKVPLAHYSSNDLAKTLAILRQSNHLTLKIKVRDLIGFGRFPYSKGRLSQKDKAVIESVISYMDLNDIADEFINNLSGGQIQRAFIAMTMAQDTQYICLDEPLNNLDMKYAVQMMELIKRYAYEFNKTIVIIIHDINFATHYADNVVALKEGQVVSCGTVEDVMQEKILSHLFDMPIRIETVDGKPIILFCTT
ncbi:ABC transporter ATP-binding protein [Streptococcus agalactiae]|uniref:Iron ABC transporter ATP-binding protein n=2 Tax=Streptococcus agalactiae TaxID=1311 RepID=A0AAD3A4J3_STRAG|nr:ATP-binding cassette domain-containing protein [Streptococcus agalactiae]EFV97320.1 ABC transporter, ATP-binding protein [Streptococcus agalactiae ATCC 13813]EPU33907.1 iron ABC transporter ATP-binding protein [Streptococcus agalactiae MRI Z1-213]EPU35992.1 iron ABC transporter ATP-binding protein [Streptococcus agalactiae MRI Z1-214]EPU39868.1 iron ABC transporter ATP-binding protein [Streptococcus agalactiae MRI Z1-216]EPU40576.1 iron ABC transporter ATP-binding protein [Streptococcus aga